MLMCPAFGCLLGISFSSVATFFWGLHDGVLKFVITLGKVCPIAVLISIPAPQSLMMPYDDDCSTF